jgi:hypothetical protein
MLPDPNTPDPTFARNFTRSGSFASDNDAINGRVDYNFSSKTRLFSRYTYLRSLYDSPPVFGPVLGGPAFGPSPQRGGTRTQSLSLNLTQMLSSNLVGEFRFGFSRFRSNLAQQDVGLQTADEIGIPGINKGDELTDGLPGLTWEGPIVGYSVGNPSSNFYQVEQSFQYATNWSAILSSHTIKFGADLRPKVKLQRIDKSLRGQFSFNRFATASADVTGLSGLGFASFLLGGPWQFTRGAYIRLPIEFQDRHGLYFQDQWRVSRKLTLTLGLRWEYFSPTYSEGDGNEVNFDFNTAQMVFAGLGGLNKYAVEPDYNNFAPRIGLAYTIDSKTVFRAGFGRSFAINRYGANFGTYCCQWPIGDNQDLRGATLYTPVFPLSQGPPDPSITTLIPIPESGRLPVPDGQFVMGRPFNDRTTYQDAWNVTIQRQLTDTFSAEIGYVGNVVRHAWRPHNANAAVPGPGSLVLRKLYGINYGLSQWIDMRSSEGNDSFHSLQARAEKRFSSGYQFLASYTWQKSMSDNYTHPFDRGAYRGPTAPAMWLTFSHVYELPFGRGKAFLSDGNGFVQALLGGWQLNGIWQFQHGQPLTPSMNANTLNTDYAQRPDRIGSGELDNPSRDAWFDVSAFRTPAPFTFGSAGTGIITGPGQWYADLGVDKSFQITESKRIGLRWQLFNAFNHVNLGNPNMTIDAPASQAAHIFNIAGTMRRMQVGLHFYF